MDVSREARNVSVCVLGGRHGVATSEMGVWIFNAGVTVIWEDGSIPRCHSVAAHTAPSKMERRLSVAGVKSVAALRATRRIGGLLILTGVAESQTQDSQEWWAAGCPSRPQRCTEQSGRLVLASW